MCHIKTRNLTQLTKTDSSEYIMSKNTILGKFLLIIQQ